jgi:hypothetical protein
MGQYYSPYVAMGNNPISMTDPTGGYSVMGGAFGDMAMDNYIDGMEYYKSNGGGWEGMTPGDRHIVQGLNQTTSGWQNLNRRMDVVSLGGRDPENQIFMNKTGELGTWSKADYSNQSLQMSRGSGPGFNANISTAQVGETWNSMSMAWHWIMDPNGTENERRALGKFIWGESTGGQFMAGIGEGAHRWGTGIIRLVGSEEAQLDFIDGIIQRVLAPPDGYKSGEATANWMIHADAYDAGNLWGQIGLNAAASTAVSEIFEMLSGGCFVAGTTVWEEKEDKNIETIKPGDKVNAYNIETGTITLKPVLQAYERTVNKLVKVEFENEALYTTLEHPFFINNAWLEAGKLKQGDALFLFDRTTTAVLKITVIDTVAKVYNITVDADHDYFVTRRKVLVHNVNCTPSVQDLLNAGNAMDQGGLTGAGRALAKHGGRPGSLFPKAMGNPAAINVQGEAILNSILNDANATSVIRHHVRFGNMLEIKTASGMGARFSADGTKFIGFIE